MFRLIHIGTIGLAALGATLGCDAVAQDWSAEERALIESLSLHGLGPLPPDPSNRVADDPRAAELGRAIFFDTRFSGDGTVSCATCHQPGHQFQDDRPLGRGMGTTNRRTMPITGMAFSPFLFWDGRKDSLWSQALGPMESPVEHGGDRTQYAHLVAEAYAAPYTTLFGDLPDLDHLPASAGPVANPEAAAAWQAMTERDRKAVSRVFANIGKSIAAYERTIGPAATRFDSYVAALPSGDASDTLTDDEIAGLRLFIGKGECVNCHNGPLLTDNHFHNTGVGAALGAAQDAGRAEGAVLVREDPFNCLGGFSDAAPDQCPELRFLVAGDPDQIGAFKTPSLRGAATRAPYMHAGQIATLDAVLRHYDAAPQAQVGQSEIRPLRLTEADGRQLAAFLAALEPNARASQ